MGHAGGGSGLLPGAPESLFHFSLKSVGCDVVPEPGVGSWRRQERSQAPVSPFSGSPAGEWEPGDLHIFSSWIFSSLTPSV